jgi:hypothetical protein
MKVIEGVKCLNVVTILTVPSFACLQFIIATTAIDSDEDSDALIDCVVDTTLTLLGKAPNGGVMSTLPVFMMLAGVSEANWNNGAMEVFNEAVAHIALGNSSLSTYVRTRQLNSSDVISVFGVRSRKLLQEYPEVIGFIVNS